MSSISSAEASGDSTTTPTPSAAKEEHLAKMREMLKEADFGPNKDFESLIRSMVQHPEKVLTVDDYVNFDNNICFTICNGRCCTGEKLIRVTPVEIDYIMKSDVYKSADRVKLITERFEIFLGGESLFPIATIRFEKRDSKLVCPFLLDVKKKVYGIDKKGRSHKLFVGNQGLCSIPQDKKPLVCMLFPLARIDMANSKTEKRNEDTLFYCQECPATHTIKMIKIRDMVSSYNEIQRKKDEYFTAMEEIIKGLKRTVDEQRTKRILVMAMPLLFFDTRETSEKIKWLKQTLEYANQKATEAMRSQATDKIQESTRTMPTTTPTKDQDIPSE